MPTASIIRAVAGDIEPAQLGVCDSHEHLLLESPLLRGEELDDVDLACGELESLARLGVKSLVEWTPCDLGRQPEGLLRASQATGVHVIAATGLHRDAHYAADFWGRDATVDELEELFVRDLTEGMDGTSVRAGIIKCGASYHRLTPFETVVIQAAAKAHVATGAPVCVHTEHGTLGHELLDQLCRDGVPAEHVVLAHLDRNPDSELHLELVARGAWLAYDRPGRIKYGPDSEILELIDAVGAERLLLGGDHARRTEHPIDWLFRKFVPRLDPETRRAILVDNPARAFAWRVV